MNSLPIKKGEIRKTGIRAMGNIPWGTHLCLFYQTKKDLIDILIPYFRVGLENNEFCLWVTSEPLTPKEAEKAMKKAVPRFARYLKKGQIEIVPYTKWYLKNDAFNLRRVLNAWIDKHNRALARGYDGIRIAGNTAWLEKKDWRKFTDYEEEVDNAIDRYRMIAVCTYSLNKCGANEIIEVVKNHQFALIKWKSKWRLIESSERKRVEEMLHMSEEKLTKTLERLTRLTKAQAKFMIDLSHELKTPLTIVKGNIDLALKKGFRDFFIKNEKSYLKMLATVDSEIGRMSKITHDLSILVKADTGQYPLLPQDVFLNNIVEKVCRQIQVLAEGQRKRIEVYKLVPIKIKVDPDKIEQLLLNILDNALKFTKEGEGIVRVSLGKTKKWAKIAISDNGVGIAKKHIPHIFERFYKTGGFASSAYKVNRLRLEQPTGSGLGLAICQWIAKAHGGKIAVKSKVGKGSTFTVYLPLKSSP